MTRGPYGKSRNPDGRPPRFNAAECEAIRAEYDRGQTSHVKLARRWQASPRTILDVLNYYGPYSAQESKAA